MRVTVLATRTAPSLDRFTTQRGHSPVEVVRRRETPYWQERGWVRQGDVYWGNYQTHYGASQGMVEDRGWGDLRFYMFEPPGQVRESYHWACFQPRGKKGFHVHMATRPADVSSGIMTIEKLITDAFEGNAQRKAITI